MGEYKFVYDEEVYPRRVYRFVPSLDGRFVAKLDTETNVLLIDTAKFNMLAPGEKELVYVAQEDMVLGG